jgi:CubicO group peptidase (beta-lactamase class C family)
VHRKLTLSILNHERKFAFGRKVLLPIAFVLAVNTPAFTQVPSATPTASAPTGAALTAKVDQLFAQWDKPDTPGCALGVIKDGQIAYRRNYGMASLELGVPISTSSVFNVGSMAKQFTAMSILMLAEQGKLSLDDSAQKYLPELANLGTPITIRQLIHHTSGLRDFLEMLEMAGWRNDDVETEKDILNLVSRQRTLNHKPGDEHLYTNTGYALLAVIIKRVSGKPLREFALENIFKPLGMTSTSFNDNHRTVINGLVNGYLPAEGGRFMKGMPADDFTGSGSLFTTVEDMARWDQNFYDRRVGSSSIIEQMLTPGLLNDGTKLEYAYGLIVSPYKGLKTVSHNGARIGYRAELLRFPAQRFSVALLCNTRAAVAPALARSVADIYLADQFKPAAASQGNPLLTDTNIIKVSEKELSDVAGLYWNPATDNLRRVYVKDGKLMFFRAQGNESELAPLGDNRFLMLGVRNRIEISFRPPRAGAPLQMLLTIDGGKAVTHDAVKTISYTPQQLAEFAGEYYSPEADATYSITPEDGKLLLNAKKWADFSLPARFTDSFANQETIGSLMFLRDAKKRVSGFVIRSGKVRNLRFNKIK